MVPHQPGDIRIVFNQKDVRLHRDIVTAVRAEYLVPSGDIQSVAHVFL